jgi:chorismate--pyruvate lyase
LYAVQPSGYHPGEVNWQDYQLLSASQLPQAIRPWLLDRGSLTQRLIDASSGDFKVQLVSQQWQQPRRSEGQLLGMKHRQQAIVREVVLLCNNQPWVFARSVIPVSAISGRLRRLRKFNDSSLGALLFSDPSMRRQPFQIAAIAGDSEQLPERLQSIQLLWGRRCRFELAGKAIMVSEVFLPTFRP